VQVDDVTEMFEFQNQEDMESMIESIKVTDPKVSYCCTCGKEA